MRNVTNEASKVPRHSEVCSTMELTTAGGCIDRSANVARVRWGAVQNKGNGLLANTKISKGELLFNEVPFVWSIKDGGTSSGMNICAECGVKIINEVGATACNNSSENSCHDEYCGKTCEEKAWKVHHALLCGTMSIPLPMEGNKENTGHQYIARKLVSMILLHALEMSERKANIGDLTSEELQAAFLTLLGDVELMKFTRCIHIHRGGKIMSDILFEEMFEASYFDGHLRESFETLRNIFVAAGAGAGFQAFFTETFYDEMMGMLMNNCQDVLLTNTGRGVVNGSALYKLYSKSNHACEATFENRSLHTEAGLEKVGVSLWATKDLEENEEIHNCYLSQGSGISIPKKERQKALAHYQFECLCSLCLEEASVESDY